MKAFQSKTSARAVSLKARALRWLAQREQSRVELRRKLLPLARADEAVFTERSGSGPGAAERVEALLDWLEANRYLSAERFAESRVQAREGRFGNLRIRHELKQHQVGLSAEATAALNQSEIERARGVLQRKFGEPASSAAERARQARFLSGRGFSPEAIGRALRHAAASASEQSATSPATSPASFLAFSRIDERADPDD